MSLGKVKASINILSRHTAWKVSKYGIFSGPYFPVFSQKTAKYGPEKTPYLDTFHAVRAVSSSIFNKNCNQL